MSNVITGGHTGELSPDAVMTGIDEVVWERFTREQQPAYLSALDSFFFNQGNTVGVGYIWDEDSGVGEFNKTAEQEDIESEDTWIGNQKTKLSQKYTKKVGISNEAFRADMVGKREKIGTQVGDRARSTRDRLGILESYGDAFSGSINTTPDGQALASNSHTTLKGATIDNLETAHMTPDNLWIQVTALANMKGQDGDDGSHTFEGILVPFLLYKTAKEVLNSTLHADSAENNLNIFETDYGMVKIKASIYLGSTYNGYANADTAYHLISAEHAVCRKVFFGLETTLIDRTVTTNDTYQHQSMFHETTFPETWTGYLGVTGAS